MLFSFYFLLYLYHIFTFVEIFSFWITCLTLLTVVDAVGFTGIVHGPGGLMVLVSWVVLSAVVFWSYNGALISLLAVRNIPQPIQTLRDLLDDHSITLVLLPMTILTDTISVSLFETRRACEL